MLGIEIPQPIPNQVCLACDVCCRFPERDSFLSPFFADEEIEWANSISKKEAQFRPAPPSRGGQLVPIQEGNGYRCPFFDPETHFCAIYDNRPLDCRLYPYMLTLDPTSSGVWLGIDTKCPGADDPDMLENLINQAGQIWESAMCPDLIECVATTPHLVGPHQPDVLPLFRLEELTAVLLSSKRLIPWRAPLDAIPESLSREKATTPKGRIGPIKPLRMNDRSIVERYLKKKKPSLAAQSFAIQFMAADLLSLVWCETEGFFCLFAFDNGTVYMPLPPLGSGDFRSLLPHCFDFMDRHNPNSEISRIENLSFRDIRRDVLAEFHIRPGYPEYVYRRKDLVELSGRKFHGRRSEWHAFTRTPGIECHPYKQSDEKEAVKLFDRWQAHGMRKTRDPMARKLLEDTRFYHLRALEEGGLMGLTGRVVYLEGRMVGYTFGVPLNEETFVVALEVTDSKHRGVSAYIFREFLCELEDFTYINVMDDSGLPGLRRLKRSYHPCHLEPSFVLYRGWHRNPSQRTQRLGEKHL